MLISSRRLLGVQNSLYLREVKTSLESKILMLLNAPYPADIRVKKEADALLQAGFQIHLLCLRKDGEAYDQQFEGIHVHRIDAGKNNFQKAFWDVIMSISFVHPRFRSAIRKIIAKESIRVIHIHDLPLAGTALSIEGVKCVLDMHENYPEALRTWFKWKKNPIVRLKNALFMNPGRWTKLERKACEGCTQIIAVVDEMKQRVIREHGIDPHKITVVTNTEDKEFLKQTLDREIYGVLKGKFILTYSGGIGPHRGVDVAIRGMKHLTDHPELQLAIVGFGSSSVMNSLKALVCELKLTNVHFIGYQPFSKFYSYMSQANVNVIPHQSNGHTDNTIPHKLFQGMMAGKPLLVSSSAPLKRVVESCSSGLVFDAGDDQDFAAKVKQLAADPALCETLGRNGTKASSEGGLNWETTSRELVRLYQSL
jgi:glycosyltransferase involved in cell wall biosynthesis